jgi:hypothetical protein
MTAKTSLQSALLARNFGLGGNAHVYASSVLVYVATEFTCGDFTLTAARSLT